MSETIENYVRHLGVGVEPLQVWKTADLVSLQIEIDAELQRRADEEPLMDEGDNLIDFDDDEEI